MLLVDSIALKILQGESFNGIRALVDLFAIAKIPNRARKDKICGWYTIQ